LKTYRSLITLFFKYSLVLVFFFSICAVSCASPQVQNDFYRGLTDSSNAVSHFEKALSSSNVYMKQAAAEELAVLMAGGTELSAGTVQRVRREASGRWAAAFKAVDDADKEKAVEFLLSHEQGSSNEARLYVLQEFEKKGINFDESEAAAIEGHFAITALRYNAALTFFRHFMEDGIWPQKIPDMFIKYPVLINDLGRAFQYTSSGTEGLTLFIDWEKNLTDYSAGFDNVRYNLLFFAARIARRSGRIDQSVSLFEQALPYAPDGEQLDACIWYILDLSINDTDVFIRRLGQLVHYCYNGSYFDDILERFLHARVSRQEWGKIIGAFNQFKFSRSPYRAAYAWIIARVIEEGYLSQEEMRLAADAAYYLNSGADIPLQRSFYQIAYNSSDGITSALYYRMLSAEYLELPFLVFTQPPASSGSRSRNERLSPALEFLLGFFSNNAADHVQRYISRMEQELSFEELRAVGLALYQEGMYVQTIRHVFRYINREGYTLDRRDLELLYPRPFLELVEKNSAESGIAPDILFGLIRTESAFQSSVVSRAGAVGLTQLMPPTAEEMAGRIRRSGGPDYAAENGLDLRDPATNVHIGAYYMNYLMVRFEDMLLSLLAYNGGMTRVRRWLNASTLPADLFTETIPILETRDYGKRVLGAAAVYRELYYR